ncbi:MAG: hypothetical protein Q7S11_04205 [bacterium]|nr:hypothetical protein [bacterium]
MDSDLKKLAEENLEISRENNKILRSMRSASRWGSVFRIFYWVIIVGSMLGAYYYFQPFIQVLEKQYQMGASFFSQLQKEGTSINQYFNSPGTTSKK